MIGRVPDATRSLRPRRRPRWWRWRARSYPHELWTTRLLAAHARQHGPSGGHPSPGKLAQGTVCKIWPSRRSSRTRACPRESGGALLPGKRDPEFDPKMAEILCVYRQVASCGSKRKAHRARTKTMAPAEASPSSPTTRSQGSRRSLRPPRIARPCRARARR